MLKVLTSLPLTSKVLRGSATESMFRQKNLLTKLHLDWMMLLGIFLLFGIGLLVLYSTKLELELVQRQGIRIIISMIILMLIAQLSPRTLKNWTPWLYFFSLIMLFLVLIIGIVSKGAQRWLDLIIFRFQPAELMKLAVPLMVAYNLDTKILPPNFKNLLLPVIYIVAPVLLIAIQPDLGTALLVASSGFLVIFFAGVSWRFIAIIVGIGISSMPILWFVLRPYQRDRILTLLNSEQDPLGAGYHIIQSKIAIGSGGVYGKGWLHGTQSQLEFLPERTTDFIFAVFGEEFGLIGILLLLIIYLLVILRGLYIGVQAQDTFCRLVCGSLILTFFVYVFVNIGMVNGILPVVGIPLPLISYGGTSMVTIMASFGIIMSIHTHRILVRK